MGNKRIIDHPVLGKLENGKKITFQFEGQTYEGFENDTVASALLANGIRTLRYQEESGNARGIYCNIGHCYECRVTINNVQNIRACLTPLKENMVIETGKKQPHPLSQENESTEKLKTYEDFIRWEEKQQHANN